MRVSRRNMDMAVFGCIVFTCIPRAFAAAGAPAQDVDTIVSRMEQAQIVSRTQQQPYVVTRNYQFFSNDLQKPNSEVAVKVEFQPPSTKNFTIQKTHGSGQGEKIVRQVLEHEKTAAQDESSHEISRRNYDFKLLRTDQYQGQPCFVLQLIPKRLDKTMIRGEAWVDTATYLIHRIDGELAKSPSWWVKDVHVTLDYGTVAGMWLQTTMLAIAHVRLFGQHVLQSQDVDCFTANSAQTAIRTHRSFGGVAAQIGLHP
ncbi:MAG TPA: outer membrane lipoprotein-sorting protein [Terriglobales bacterium]|nr:outer membrane lipoprotein-sorting protein [Terriglobales bacterium]